MTQKPTANNNPFQSGGNSQRPTPTSGSLLSRAKPAIAQSSGSNSSSRYGTNASRLPPPRFGPAQTNWEVLPTSDIYVRFTLEGMGGSLQRIPGDLSASGTYETALRSMENNRDALNQLTRTLNEAWEGCNLMGALLVYPQIDEQNQVIAETLKAAGARAVYLRALDPLLVLNVLARTRNHLLQTRAPLAFDDTVLHRALLADDPRLIRLVQDTGYIEEAIPHQPEPVEDTES